MSIPGVSTIVPELVLCLGAFASLVLGLGRRSSLRALVTPAALVSILLAILATWSSRGQNSVAELPGILVTPLTFYVRMITLPLALCIALINAYQPADEERGEFVSLMLFSVAGVLLTSLANDWVVLFLAVELVSVPTYVLVALSRTDARASEASLKYFFLGALSAALLAYGLTFLYGASGTTHIMQLTDGAWRGTLAPSAGATGAQIVGLVLVIGGLAFKIAAVPLHGYVADVYEGAASSVTGMLGYVPKAAGFVAILQVLGACLWDLPPALIWLLWIMAAGSMTVGNVLGLWQRNIKRMLAYSSVAHTGYILVGVTAACAGLGGPWLSGSSSVMFYLFVYGAMNLGAFALLSAFRVNDAEIETLEDVGGLATKSPLWALAFAVCVFGLMGMPPTAGFVAKLYVVGSALSVPAGQPFHTAMLVLAVIAVANTAVGAAYYLRILAGAYAKQESYVAARPRRAAVALGLGLCALPVLVLFVRPTELSRAAQRATIGMGLNRSSPSRLTSDTPRETPVATFDRSGQGPGNSAISEPSKIPQG